MKLLVKSQNVSTWIIIEEIVRAWSGIPSLTKTTKTLQQISNAARAFLLLISGDGVLPSRRGLCDMINKII